MIDYTKINSETWDSWAEDGCEYTLPISHEEYEKITPDSFAVILTPCIAVPHEWFGDLKGKKVLGLASGGGQLKAGFTLKALYEDRDGEGGNIIGKYYPQYIATFAVK